MNRARIAIAVLVSSTLLTYAQRPAVWSAVDNTNYVKAVRVTSPSGSQAKNARPTGTPSPTTSWRLLFSSRRSGNQGVYALDPATRKVTNLTNNAADDGYPRMSPDGQRIAFASNREGYWTIYLMKPDGAQPVRLLKDRSESGYADWSPDSRSLVFAASRPGDRKNEIYVIGADGSSLRKLTNHPAEDVHPAWSPDGRKIAFASERDGNRRIYTMNADGSGLVCLTNGRWYSGYPAWSPDGSQIAFASDRDSEASSRLEIYVMNADGANARRITNHTADDRHPCWSLDGKMLAFASDRRGDRDIFTVNVDGFTAAVLVRAVGDDEHPHWSLAAAYTAAGAVQGGKVGIGIAEINLRRQLFQQMIADGEIDKKLCAETGENDPVKLIETEKVDLNGDGVPEIKVFGQGCACQGARRCMQWLYRKSGARYELLASIAAAEEISLLKTSTNGYRDLNVAYPAGINYPGWNEVYRFDGRRYLEPRAQQSAKNRISPGSSNQSPATTANQPPTPYEDHGACPFECCTYRRWTVKAQTAVRQDRHGSSPVAFTLRRGERVTGMTGVVITTQPGQARVLKPTVIGGLQVRSGETVHLLTYIGEGFYKVWYKGKVEELPIVGEGGFTIIRAPKAVWWVKVKNSKGQIGWTDQTNNFNGMDACG